jgi:hypothetical protein
VAYDGGVQQVRDHLDDREGSHEHGVTVERKPLVVVEQLQVARHVYNQKTTQKQARE